jgi:hypothetical protein
MEKDDLIEHTLGGCFFSGTPKLRELVGRVLLKIDDEKVQEFISNNCVIQGFSKENKGFVFSVDYAKEHGKKYPVFLSEETAIEFTVAHEFAHAYLGHTGFLNKEVSEKEEKEANELAMEWGFKKNL